MAINSLDGAIPVAKHFAISSPSLWMRTSAAAARLAGGRRELDAFSRGESPAGGIIVLLPDGLLSGGLRTYPGAAAGVSFQLVAAACKGDFNQLRQRLRSGFLHNASTVGLDGPVAEVQFRGDLLIGMAGDDQ